jgi:hypothetical protein
MRKTESRMAVDGILFLDHISILSPACVGCVRKRKNCPRHLTLDNWLYFACRLVFEV